MNKNQRNVCLIVLERDLSTFGKKIEKEYKFLKKRRFRFDYAVLEYKIAVEVNGGQWVSGRHNRGGKGYEKDLEKLNLAQLEGWTVLQYTYEMIASNEHNKAFELLKLKTNFV